MNQNDAYKSYVRKIWILIALAAGLAISLIYLSDTSLYRIKGVSGPMRIDLALMLTPFGIIKNLLIESSSWLKPYYSAPAERHGIFDDPWLRHAIVAVWAFAISLLFTVYRSRKSDGTESGS